MTSTHHQFSVLFASVCLMCLFQSYWRWRWFKESFKIKTESEKSNSHSFQNKNPATN